MKLEENSKLVQILNYAKKNIPFYQNILSDSENVLEGFEEIPIITKREMRDNLLKCLSLEIMCKELYEAISTQKDFANEYSYNLAGKKVIGEYTSGTSGMPFLSLKTLDERMILGKKLWKMRRGFGNINPSKMFNFVHNFGEKKYPFPFEKDKNETEMLKKELNYLCESDYVWWHIHARKIYKYMDLMEKSGIIIPALRVIENTGSFLSDVEKEEIERFFDCQVADNYGCREVWTIAFSSKDKQLCVNSDTLFFEIVDERGKQISSPNQVGDIVVTSYYQKVMPFIRYKVGDRGCYLPSYSGGDKIIKIIPDRSIIIGTNLYGNYYFKSVVLLLSTEFGIANFDEISVQQIECSKFVVNIKGYSGDKKCIESAFAKASKYVFKHNDYNYLYTYNEKYTSKSLFSVGKLL